VLTVQLPRVPAWERWGLRAGVIKALGAATIREGDVHHAVQVATRVDARVVFLLHEDSAALDFGAARAILDWAARGGNRTTHVLPLAVSRLSWARNADDLLDLVEERRSAATPSRCASDRVFQPVLESRAPCFRAPRRGARRATGWSSPGCGASASLARDGGGASIDRPSAYVDLAGFHHEVGFVADPSHAVDAILRAVCARLVESALAL